MGRRLLIALAGVTLVTALAMTLLLSSGDDETPGTEVEARPSTTTTTSAPPASDPAVEDVVDGPLQIADEDGQVIEGVRVSNPEGNCVEIEDSSDVVVRDSVIGPCGDYAVVIDNSTTVRIEGLTISESGSGVYAHSSESISVVDNLFHDAGRNFIQFDKVTGDGNEILRNEGRNRLGGSNAEDFVSLYRSAGTDESPLRVAGNEFSDGGPSESGSGIMIGDSGGSDIVVEDNTLINPGQVGIGVSGGHDIRVLGNEIYSAAHQWSNVGIYVWNQTDESCRDIEIRDNRVDWSGSQGSPNPHWNSGSCGEVAGWDDNDWDADLG